MLLEPALGGGQGRRPSFYVTLFLQLGGLSFSLSGGGPLACQSSPLLFSAALYFLSALRYASSQACSRCSKHKKCEDDADGNEDRRRQCH
ncbi:hypothetical protein CIW49_13530 [Mycolicibacterium sp. P1-18]|nr:hypothetical protein CIW49_13530 [Mycolicibacterium sp. P1-18]